MVQTAAHCVYSASFETAMSQATFVPGFLPNNADSEYAPHTVFALQFFLVSCLLMGTCQHTSACMSFQMLHHRNACCADHLDVPM